MKLETAYELYSTLTKIRMAEEGIVNEYGNQQIRTPVHLCIGQEAIAAGVSLWLDRQDCIISNHRCHGHSLAKGLDLESFFLELYGKQGGTTRGWGGSMHLCDKEHGVVGTSAIVAGGIPIGAGVAMAQKYTKTNQISVIYFGDGAIDEGVFWETINFASLQKLPILFVLEDNGYASQTSSDMRHAYKDIRPIITGFGLPVKQVDGSDTIAVAETAGRMIGNIRAGQGPEFLICRTFRWMGHVGPADDTATGYRTPEEVTFWREKCPLKMMQEYLLQRDPEKSKDKIQKIDEYWQERVLAAIHRAKEAPYAVD